MKLSHLNVAISISEKSMLVELPIGMVLGVTAVVGSFMASTLQFKFLVMLFLGIANLSMTHTLDKPMVNHK